MAEYPRYGPPKPSVLHALESPEARAIIQALPPANEACRCPSVMATLLCPTGHLLECHYPMRCQEAQCSHYLEAMAEREEQGQ